MERRAASPAPVRNGHRPTDAVARKILEECRRVDADCAVTYVSVDEHGRTTLRIRASVDSSVTALQRALREHLPLAKVRTSENPLDGSLQAQITTTCRADEFSIARSRVSKSRWLSAMTLGSALCVLAGIATIAKTTFDTLPAEVVEAV